MNYLHQRHSNRDKSIAFTLINALPLCFFRGIYRADCNEWTSVKKITLFEHSELGIFRKGANARKVPDSHRARSRHESFFGFVFLRRKKGKGIVIKFQCQKKFKYIKK